MNHKPSKGKIEWNEKWELSPQTEIALSRLTELGVSIGTAITKRRANYSLRVPYELPPMAYLEIGYLVDVLSDTVFPEGLWNYGTLSGVRSKVLGDKSEDVAPIEYDADPECYIIRIYLKEDREQFKRNAEKRKMKDPDNHIERSRAQVFIGLGLSGMSVDKISEKTGAAPDMIRELIKKYSRIKID
jgi:hypothetical protein